MAAERSALHCPDCGHNLLILTGGGLFCARCGTPVVKVPAGSDLQETAELGARRLRARAHQRAARSASQLH